MWSKLSISGGIPTNIVGKIGTAVHTIEEKIQIKIITYDYYSNVTCGSNLKGRIKFPLKATLRGFSRGFIYHFYQLIADNFLRKKSKSVQLIQLK